jgi:hypothetical protein
MFWKKKKTPIDNFYFQLEKQFEENPDKMFVCEKYLAVKMPDLAGIFVVVGDYRECSDEECNVVLQEAMTRFQNDHKAGILMSTKSL